MTFQATRPAAGTASAQAERSHFSRRILKLEYPANVGPLIHLALWMGLLAVGLLVPAATNWYVAVPLIIVLALATLSITVGILHLHTHRQLFVSHRLNRVVDVLCTLPGAPTAADMREAHVLNHHRFNDGPRDITSTEGREHGLRAVWYWITFHPVVKLYTMRTVFAANPSAERRKRRHQFVLDLTLYAMVIGTTAYFADTTRFLLFYGIPFLLVQLNSGYFAWLTHAPARVFDDDPSKSINTVGNVLNFFIFNQGYHSVHHRYPGIHWSQIPDKLDFMRQVEPDVIVPYWMTLNSTWRLLVPGGFLEPTYGEQWKAKLEKRLDEGSVRARYLPWFAWI
jgi:fatty acid desaturase